jgi:tetratricopeptide (TPR) repeat protein
MSGPRPILQHFSNLWIRPAFLLLVSVSICSAQQPNVLRSAQQALESGDIPGAVRLLESYRGTHPRNPDVYNLLGIAYGRGGDGEKSLAMFQKYARLRPGRPEAYNNLGAAYLHQGDARHAEAAFRQALALNTGDVNALYNLGALLNSAHKYADSRPLLGRAHQRDRSPAITYELAVATAGIGDRKGALHILSSAAPPAGEDGVPWLRLVGTLTLDEGDLVAASAALEKAVALAPDDRQSLYALALLRLKQRRTDDALTLMDKSMQDLSPAVRHLREGTMLASYRAYTHAIDAFQQATVEDPGSYDAFYNLAVLRLEQTKDLAASLQAAQRALAIKDTGEVHDLLGDIYEARREYKDALAHYQEAVRLAPASDKFTFDLGAELLLHENFAPAESVFHAAEARFPKSAKVLVGLGTSQFLGGKTAEAVDSFLKAVDLDPTFEPAYIFLGEAFSFSGARAGAVAAKLAYFARNRPDSFSVQYYYGAALVKQMDEDKNMSQAQPAKTALERAAALQPRDARVYYQMGELSRVERRLPDAVALYEKAIALDPNFPEPLYRAGQAYVQLGRQKEAKEMFARHREVLAKAQANLEHRTSEIQSFVLKMKGAE